ncbi:MAG: tail fiber protein, partial [Phascolarctobacterium sp.]|nr:tail fiber protein [Phascolarctobacterium sp.]
MALPGNKNFSDYDNYVTDPNPTTSAQAQDYFRNQAELLKAVIDCDFWQPETVYQPGDVVKSDSMPNGTEAVMVATKASVTSNVEPQWGAVGGANISDGACFWKLRWKHWSKEGYAMADYPLRNKAYSLNAIVACPYHAEFMLKCTQAGTTSTGSLDTTSATLGKVYTDGGVKWEVINPLNDYLPKTGGTLSGDIAFSKGSFVIQGIGTEKMLVLRAAGEHTGGSVIIFGQDNQFYNGKQVRIRAANGNTYRDLSLGWDGLDWNGEPVQNPVGTIIAYLGETPPKGYLKCSGASLNLTTYSKLFDVIGTTFG